MRENVKNIVDQVKSLNKSITNADRIRSMSDEELAEFFSETCCPSKFGGKGNCNVGCVECWLDWLKQEAT